MDAMPDFRIFLLAILAVSVLVMYPLLFHDPCIGSNETEMIIMYPDSTGTPVLYAEVADTPEELRSGLMYRESMPNDQGMLFVFAGGNAQRSFWMKNTLIPLDMIFVNSSMEIVSIQADVPPCVADPCPTYGSVKPAKYVIETNAGYAATFGIEPGQMVTLEPLPGNETCPS